MNLCLSSWFIRQAPVSSACPVQEGMIRADEPGTNVVRIS